MKKISDYRTIVGDAVIGELYQKAKALYGKKVLHINSTFIGGGVAEILNSLVPLMNNIGLEADWRVLHATVDLYNLTKSIHNALQGEDWMLAEHQKQIYVQASELFSAYAMIYHDLVIIHDPQPLPLIDFYKKKQPWVWRCHIDLSAPNPDLWDFMKGFILRYDLAIMSKKEYTKKDLPVRQRVIQPVIDPLTRKNIPLSDQLIQDKLKEFQIPTDKPIITQISRFDKWKDPLGVIEIMKKVKQKVDCRLILCGSMAMDDPEGVEIYETVHKVGKDLIDRGDLILITFENSLLVNVLQRVSSVVIQKSLREGFGLTVTEAMWKGKPVLASNVGGIPLQITDNVDGLLVDPQDIDGAADRVLELLKKPEWGKKLGKKAVEKVRENFLITRLLRDYLDMIYYELIIK
ncbi:glycosyltransferase [bacterium]|nr:glycosyltransferase [bacterium]